MTLCEFVRTVKTSNVITIEMDGMIVEQKLTPQIMTFYGMREVKEVTATNVDALNVKISSENSTCYLNLGCGV